MLVSVWCCLCNLVQWADICRWERAVWLVIP